jgi:hypothetical protein
MRGFLVQGTFLLTFKFFVIVLQHMVKGVGFGSGNSLGLVKLLNFLLDSLEDIHIFFHLLGLLRGFFHIKLINWRHIFIFESSSRMVFFDFYRLSGWRSLKYLNCKATWHSLRFRRQSWFWRFISLHFEPWSNSLNWSMIIFWLRRTLFIITRIILNRLLLCCC